ncbi:MAG: ATP-binding protein [Thermodesulfobacteriota bacterium]
MLNLVRNAVQAAPEEGRVQLEWFDEDCQLGYRVIDDGPGVPQELLGRLFEPFFTTKPVDEGTGLGLAVAQAAARDHGGVISCDQSELGGAQFKMVFDKRPQDSVCEEDSQPHDRGRK